MLKTSIGLALFAASLLPAWGGNEKSFEGKWVLDEKSSSATPMIDTLVQEIKHDGGEMRIISTWKEPKNGVAPLLYLGIMHTELKLSCNGREIVSQIGPYQHRAKTVLEGNRLVSDWVAGMDNGKPMTGQWVRELGPDGKSMTLQIKTAVADGRKNEATLVFKRK